MSKFDAEEQNIYDAFSQITVDSSKLRGEVKRRLHEERSCIVNKPQRRWAKSAVAAMVMSMLLAVTVTAASLGGFDWFIEKFNPSFSEIVEPVELYSEDQGIRMEVIGAKKYDNKAIVYLSLQDITGQNRLTEQTAFNDGFSIKMNPKTQGISEKMAKMEHLSSFSWSQEVLYFNEDTNTVYYEFDITADPDTPLADPLELGSFLIYFDERTYREEPMNLSLGGIEVVKTTPITEKQIFGGSNVPNDRNSFTEALTPGYYMDMPHGEDDQWVSNIGIIDGKLHVQIGKIFNKEFGSSDAMLFLIDVEGNVIPFDYELVFLGDGEKRLLNLEENDYADAVYKYEEAVFSVNTEELSDYTLCFTGRVSYGVEGNWKVRANLSDTSQDMRIWKNHISVEGHLFEHITLSPLGLQVIGTYEGEECLASNMSLAVETVDGIVPLKGGGGSQNSANHTFSANWDTETPLDVTKVTGIIINDVRIPAK